MGNSRATKSISEQRCRREVRARKQLASSVMSLRQEDHSANVTRMAFERLQQVIPMLFCLRWPWHLPWYPVSKFVPYCARYRREYKSTTVYLEGSLLDSVSAV